MVLHEDTPAYQIQALLQALTANEIRVIGFWFGDAKPQANQRILEGIILGPSIICNPGSAVVLIHRIQGQWPNFNLESGNATNDNGIDPWYTCWVVGLIRVRTPETAKEDC